MADFSEIADLIPALRGRVGDACDLAIVRTVMQRMTDAEIIEVLEEATAAAQQLDQISLVASGVVAARSKRQAGHSGLAQSRGHSSAASLIQHLTGSTKSEASRQARVGEQLVTDGEGTPDADGQPPGGGGAAGGDARAEGDGPAPTQPPRDWRAPLKHALAEGRLTQAQFDAIDRGLGEPPRATERLGADAGTDAAQAFDDEARDAWAEAAEQLVGEAPERTVEELRVEARSIRDLLDPEGAEERFLARFERRSFRIWIDRDGQRRASIAFDDEGGAFYEALVAAALRPRRGGPRFVDAAEKQAAQELADDPRTNDQLTYDLFLDLIRTGALADAESVLGARQAGVRLVQKVAADGTPAPVAHTEDGLITVPGASAAQRICDAGSTLITIDPRGNPLDVGRSRRLFTPRQRIALAIRDGGCRWPGCDRPASYCEAHHSDEWSRGGRTDVDCGILLCRFHHMNLHHGGWRIARDGSGDFVLHDPSGARHPLRRRAVLRYAWGELEPPSTRFRTAA